MKIISPDQVRVPQAGECPDCLARVDGATPLTPNTTPEAGSITVCAYCGAVLVFTETLELTRITDEVWETMPAATANTLRHYSALFKRLRQTVKKDDLVLLINPALPKR